MRVLIRQRGVSLIEVLVAIIVFSAGVLGIAAMQMKGAQFSQQASARTQIILQTRSLVDAMRANAAAARAPVVAGSPATPTADQCPYCFAAGAEPPAVSTCTTTCTPKQIAQNDVYRWISLIKSAAPASLGTSSSITWNASMGTYEVTARWSGGAMSGDAAKTSVTDDLSYTLTVFP